MDPNACVRKFIEAKNIADRKDAANDYSRWVAVGGFRAVVTVDGKLREVVGILPLTGCLQLLASNTATDRAKVWADDNCLMVRDAFTGDE